MDSGNQIAKSIENLRTVSKRLIEQIKNLESKIERTKTQVESLSGILYTKFESPNESMDHNLSVLREIVDNIMPKK